METREQVFKRVRRLRYIPTKERETIIDMLLENPELQPKKLIREVTEDVLKERVTRIETCQPIPTDIEPKLGEFYQLDKHIIYCGDTSCSPSADPTEFVQNMPEAAFAFADPPYGLGVDHWDTEFFFNHDYLIDKAPIVAVTPGQNSLQRLLSTTSMPYKYAMASWITNGMTHGAIGYQNWILIALFAREGVSLYRQSQDIVRITIQTSGNTMTAHKGRKPSQLMLKLFDTFTDTGNIIIDPFLGSGSSLFAAEVSDRVFYGGDLSPEYIKKAIERWQGITGLTARILK